MSNQICCPKCGCEQVAAGKRGFNLFNAVVWGAAANFNPTAGLVAGMIGSNALTITCLGCGHSFKPGQGRLVVRQSQVARDFDEDESADDTKPVEDDRWRYKFHDGRWWYFKPDGQWRVKIGNDWLNYEDAKPMLDQDYRPDANDRSGHWEAFRSETGSDLSVAPQDRWRLDRFHGYWHYWNEDGSWIVWIDGGWQDYEQVKHIVKPSHQSS